MFTVVDYGAILSAISVAGYLLLALQLYRYGMAADYANFTRYLIAEAIGVSTFLLLMAARRPRWAAMAYMVLQPALWIFYVLVTLELYRRVLSRYRGISRVVQRVLVSGLLVALFLSLSGLSADLQLERHASALPILFVTAGHRAIVGTLTIFLLILTAFLTWFPVPLSPNAVLHTAVFFLYFLSLTVGHLYRNLTGTEVTPVVNLSLALLTNVCLGLWLWRLRPAGERTPAIPGPAHSDGHWLLAQLETVNRSLLRPSR